MSEELMEFDNILGLTDEDGNEQEFEILDVIEYEGHEYLVLIENEEEAETVLILEVKECEDDPEMEEYTSVDDEALLGTLYEIFKKNNEEFFNFIED